MKETLIDIETYCEADIKKCGLYRYVSDPSFEILLIAWATDEGSGFGETKLADLASGDSFPQELLDDFKDSNVTLIAHNAAFERVSFSRYLQQHYPGQYLKPGTFLSPNNWICTMVMAASLTLPMALKDVGEVLRTTQQKDEEGKRLIKLFSAPCKPTKSNGGRTRNLPHHLPEDWAKFKYYCIQDVNTEVDIYKRLKRFPMPDREWHHYRVNERINDRGVRIDTKLVQQAITCDLLLSDAMTTKAYELTGLENPNSVSQLKTWLDERGISMDTLGKKNVTEMIGELDKNGVDAEAMDMLKLRLQMAKSSVKKYQAAERCVCPDGRARGLFQFYGASRTGRYSGRNIQLQNLPQNHISTLDEARTLVKMGCFDMVESIYGNTPDVLSQLIRTMLIPRNGCEFIVADFSAIEARVLAWEAGEQWVLDAFKNGEDLYCATASQMFHVPVVKHGINGDLRQKGKIATLACGYGGSSGAALVVLAHVRTHHVRRGHRRAVVGGTPTLEERVVKQVREHRVIHQSRKHCHNRYSSHIGVERVGLPRRPGDWPCRCGLSWPFPEPLSELLLLPCATTYRYSVLTFPDFTHSEKVECVRLNFCGDSG